jgi:uncharacterized protein YcaQ
VVHHLTREAARRIAVRAQLLDADRPPDLLVMIQQLTMLQLDPTAAIAPSADLVAWSRLGSSYRPEQLQHALERDRTLFEFDAVIRPVSDLGLYLAETTQPLRYERTRSWLRDNDAFRRDILDRLERMGPLTSRDIPDTSVVPWPSSGWTNNRNVTKMLEILVGRGQVAIAGRVGRERVWDLPQRVYPEVAVPPFDEALRVRNERRLSSLGIARSKAIGMPVEPIDVGSAGEPARVEGVKGEWRVDPAAAERDAFEGRTALLSPFDRLIHDRRRALELFDFDYTLEMYKPVDKRRWGYYALPILHGDRLIGKVDAVADRKASVLRVNAFHQDVPWSAEMRRGVQAELESLAEWLGMGDISQPRTQPHRGK